MGYAIIVSCILLVVSMIGAITSYRTYKESGGKKYKATSVWFVLVIVFIVAILMTFGMWLQTVELE